MLNSVLSRPAKEGDSRQSTRSTPAGVTIPVPGQVRCYEKFTPDAVRWQRLKACTSRLPSRTDSPPATLSPWLVQGGATTNCYARASIQVLFSFRRLDAGEMRRPRAQPPAGFSRLSRVALRRTRTGSNQTPLRSAESPRGSISLGSASCKRMSRLQSQNVMQCRGPRKYSPATKDTATWQMSNRWR